MRRAGLLLLLLPFLSAAPAVAGVREFLEACAAEGADFTTLPARLTAAGWVEVAPDEGPRGPAIAQSVERRRLWSRPGWNGSRGDAFTGLATGRVPDTAHMVEVCWHGSRPGESGAAALAALRGRLPPAGPSDRGTAFFYGGRETWPTILGGETVFVEVSWPIVSQPETGAALLSLTRLAEAGEPQRRGAKGDGKAGDSPAREAGR